MDGEDRLLNKILSFGFFTKTPPRFFFKFVQIENSVLNYRRFFLAKIKYLNLELFGGRQ